MNEKSLLIIGSSSMVASRFVELFQTECDMYLADRHAEQSSHGYYCDITDRTNVEAVISRVEAETVILFSAFTDVDAAEQERGDINGLAWKINVEGTKYVADACKENQKKLVFISTDFVFDGKRGEYTEEDLPITSAEEGSWYGWTKRLGEQFTKELGEDNFIIARVSYPFRARFAPKQDFVRKMIVKMRGNSLYPMFDDQKITPTFIDDFVYALFTLIEHNASGIYNIVGSPALSPYTIAKSINEVFELDAHVSASQLADYVAKQDNPHMAALRYPVNSSLSNAKIINFLEPLGIELHTFVHALKIMKDQGVDV